MEMLSVVIFFGITVTFLASLWAKAAGAFLNYVIGYKEIRVNVSFFVFPIITCSLDVLCFVQFQ